MFTWMQANLRRIVIMGTNDVMILGFESSPDIALKFRKIYIYNIKLTRMYIRMDICEPTLFNAGLFSPPTLFAAMV